MVWFPCLSYSAYQLEKQEALVAKAVDPRDS